MVLPDILPADEEVKKIFVLHFFYFRLMTTKG